MMNRRGFLGAFTAAVAGTAASAVPTPASEPEARVIVGRRVRHPANLEWVLPEDFTLDDLQNCADRVHAIDRRLDIVSVEFGSHQARRRCLTLFPVERRVAVDGRAAFPTGLTFAPIYVNEAIGPLGLRFAVEPRGPLTRKAGER